MKRFHLAALTALSLFSAYIAYPQTPRLAATSRTGGILNGGAVIFHDLPTISSNTIVDFYNAEPHQPLTGVVRGNSNWLYGTLTYNGTTGTGCLFRVNINGNSFSKISDLNSSVSVNTTPYFHTDNIIYFPAAGSIRKFNTTNSLQSSISISSDVHARNLVIDATDWIYYTTVANTIEKIRTDGSGWTTLHMFGAGQGTDGREGLTEIPGDSLIGVQRFEGSLNGGTLYTIKKDGTGFTVLHNFDHGSGRYPMTRPYYLDGKLFGTTSEGGLNDNGVVYCINPDGTNFRVLHHFEPSILGSSPNPAGNIFIASNGRLFGNFIGLWQDPTTFAYQRMFKMDTSGANFEYFAPMADQRLNGDTQVGIFLDNDDQIYLMSMFYGRYNGGVLSSFDTLGVGNPLFYFGHSDVGFEPNKLIKASDGRMYGTTTIGGLTGNGRIYSIDETGNDLELLHEFSDADGYWPKGKLVEASDGKLYGVTSTGGPLGSGCVYRINKNGTGFQVIHVAGNFPDGASLWGGLLEHNNALYGISLFGGTIGAGTLFKMNFDGTGYTVIHNFGDVAGDLQYPQGGIIYSGGYLYGTGSGGGASSLGGVYRIHPDGTGYEVLHEFNNTDGANPFIPPTIASNGMLYGVTQLGGANGWGVLYRIETDGDNYTVLRHFDTDIDGYIPNDLLQASDGMLYGTTGGNTPTSGANYGGTIYRINLDGTGFTTIFRSDEPIQGGNLDGLLDYSLAVLPVELLTFSGRSKDDGIHLVWKTVTEVNSDHFELERSNDGASFQKIATILAAGNSQTLRSYTHLDRNPFNGVNYYRLKIVDIDGSLEYSRIIRVDLFQKGAITVYPNPASNFINISGISDAKEIRVTDASGRMMLKKTLAPDTSNEQLDISSLPNGMYMIYVYGEDVKTTRFIKKN